VLFEVATLGYRELFLWLIEHGADPLATNNDGQNILDYLYDRFPIDKGEENATVKMVAFLIENVPAIKNLDIMKRNTGSDESR